MANVVTLDASTVASFLARQIKGKTGISEHEIAEALSEVELQTQTKGSSFIKLHFIDPEWDLITSGLFDRNGEGLLPEVEVEFPQRSGWRWILCACEPSNELSQPNFVATFEDKIVRLLKNKWGSKRAKPGYNTRAEFVRELCVEAGVKYCIPSVEGAQERLNKELTVIGEAAREAEAIAFNRKFNEEFNKNFNEEHLTEGESALTPEGEAAVKAKALKTPGIGAGSGVTVKGVAADAEQIATMNEVMADANGLKAGQLATEALVVACIVESEFRKEAAGGGLLQFEGITAKGLKVEPGNVGQAVDAVLSDPGATGIGGMISLARKHPTYAAWKIAQEEQGSGAGKATEGAANYGPWVPEARKLIAAYGGVKATGGGGSPATSKAGEVARGTSQNPDENSWDCMVRLAGAVNWSVFTNGQTLFYMDGPEMAGQRPNCYVYPKPSLNKIVKENTQGHKITETGLIQVPMNATFDDTSVEFFADHKIKGRVQKRSRIGRPQSPSEIKLNLVCGTTDYAAGEVWEFIEAGPLNGRWIITDATRNCFKDKFTQFILEPPSAPVTENEEGKPGEKAELPVEAGTGGKLEDVATQALKAWGEHSKYVYTEEIPARENGRTLYGPAPRYMDCSSFAENCLKEAGVKDPSGYSYNPIGNTDSLIKGMERASSPEPGMLAFFGPSESATQHVVVYVGNGEAVGMETYGVNMLRGSVESLGTGAGLFLGYFRPR